LAQKRGSTVKRWPYIRGRVDEETGKEGKTDKKNAHNQISSNYEQKTGRRLTNSTGFGTTKGTKGQQI